MALQTDLVPIEGVQLEVARLPGNPGLAPLLFLHEGLGSVSAWGQAERCWPAALCKATGRGGIVCSRRGYGRSDPIPDVRGPSSRTGFWPQGRHRPDYMHFEAMEVLPRLLQACEVERPVLVGHSDGGTIALLHASRFETTACVAIAPHVFVEPVALAAIAQARQAYETGALRERLARHHENVDNAFWQWNDVWLSPAFASFDIRDDCTRITVPLLVAQGLDDAYGTLAQLDEIGHRVPGMRRLELAQCGHSPHRDQPDRLTRAVADFLADLP